MKALPPSRLIRPTLTASLLTALLSGAGCNFPGLSASEPQTVTDGIQGQPAPIDDGDGAQHDGGTGGAPAIGPDCRTGDATRYCLAVNYVVYRDPTSEEPVVSAAEAISNIEVMNSRWETCGIAFQIDRFQEVFAADYNLAFHTANNSELTAIRRAAFADTSSPIDSLLVVTTGSWNRSGSLGATGANAWAQMPGGSGPFGVVLESTVGTYPNLIAHELGHSLNLDHGGGSGNLMNPIIYTTSTQLTESQCETARAAANRYWPGALR